MSGLFGVEDRIAAVAELHRPYGLDCKCGRPINSDADWSRHVAGEVAKALQLKEETATAPTVVGRVECTCGITTAGGLALHDSSCGFDRGHFEFAPQSRVVSPWVSVPQEGDQ